MQVGTHITEIHNLLQPLFLEKTIHERDFLGEMIAVVVVLAPGSSLTIETLAADVGGELSGAKLPSRVVSVAEIPKGPTGKVQRNALPRLLAAEIRQASSGHSVSTH